MLCRVRMLALILVAILATTGFVHAAAGTAMALTMAVTDAAAADAPSCDDAGCDGADGMDMADCSLVCLSPVTIRSGEHAALAAPRASRQTPPRVSALAGRAARPDPEPPRSPASP